MCFRLCVLTWNLLGSELEENADAGVELVARPHLGLDVAAALVVRARDWDRA